MFPKPISWPGMEKLNLMQQKHTLTNQKKCTTTQKKTKARFNRLLWHPAWKWKGPILVSELHKCVTYLLIYLDRHLPTFLQLQDPHGASLWREWFAKPKGFKPWVKEWWTVRCKMYATSMHWVLSSSMYITRWLCSRAYNTTAQCSLLLTLAHLRFVQ